MSKVIQSGKRVYLRHPTLNDMDDFLDLVQRSRKLHRPWIYPPENEKSYHQYIHKLNKDRHIGFLVCLKSTNEIIGVINLNEIVRGLFQSAYLGFYGFESYSGKGYMTEGLNLVIKHAFTKLKLHRLEANIQPKNKKSISLVKRCGFHKEGYSPKYLKIGGKWKDHERWAILN